MVNLGMLSGTTRSTKVSFRIPYNTKWGENLVVCGSEAVLGSWNVKKGLLLTPVHQGNELVWYGSVSVTTGFSTEYSYYVLDDHKNVLRWEMGKKRKLLLPHDVKDGQVVEFRDLWQVRSTIFPPLFQIHIPFTAYAQIALDDVSIFMSNK